MVRNPLARWWRDRCDIIVKEGHVDATTGRTVFVERVLQGDIACRVSFRMSFETLRAARAVGDFAKEANQAVKLFLAPDVVVPEGSKVLVRHGGQVSTFGRSGVPAVFERHQEVRLERLERFI